MSRKDQLIFGMTGATLVAANLFIFPGAVNAAYTLVTTSLAFYILSSFGYSEIFYQSYQENQKGLDAPAILLGGTEIKSADKKSRIEDSFMELFKSSVAVKRKVISGLVVGAGIAAIVYHPQQMIFWGLLMVYSFCIVTATNVSLLMVPLFFSLTAVIFSFHPAASLFLFMLYCVLLVFSLHLISEGRFGKLQDLKRLRTLPLLGCALFLLAGAYGFSHLELLKFNFSKDIKVKEQEKIQLERRQYLQIQKAHHQRTLRLLERMQYDRDMGADATALRQKVEQHLAQVEDLLQRLDSKKTAANQAWMDRAFERTRENSRQLMQERYQLIRSQTTGFRVTSQSGSYSGLSEKETQAVEQKLQENERAMHAFGEQQGTGHVLFQNSNLLRSSIIRQMDNPGLSHLDRASLGRDLRQLQGLSNKMDELRNNQLQERVADPQAAAAAEYRETLRQLQDPNLSPEQRQQLTVKAKDLGESSKNSSGLGKQDKQEISSLLESIQHKAEKGGPRAQELAAQKIAVQQSVEEKLSSQNLDQARRNELKQELKELATLEKTMNDLEWENTLQLTAKISQPEGTVRSGNSSDLNRKLMNPQHAIELNESERNELREVIRNSQTDSSPEAAATREAIKDKMSRKYLSREEGRELARSVQKLQSHGRNDSDLEVLKNNEVDEKGIAGKEQWKQLIGDADKQLDLLSANASQLAESETAAQLQLKLDEARQKNDEARELLEINSLQPQEKQKLAENVKRVEELKKEIVSRQQAAEKKLADKLDEEKKQDKPTDWWALLKKLVAPGLLILAVMIFVRLFRKKGVTKVEPENPDVLPELREEWRKLKRLKLSPREEVIHYYNLFHDSLQKLHYQAAETPPSCIVRDDMEEFNPELQKPTLALTEIYAQCFYGNREVTADALKVFRKSIARILKVYQLG